MALLKRRKLHAFQIAKHGTALPLKMVTLQIFIQFLPQKHEHHIIKNVTLLREALKKREIFYALI